MSRKGMADQRGSSTDRDVRAWKLLEIFGNGYTARCHWCPKVVNRTTLHQDRIVPGTRGGRYTMENLVAACPDCNIVKKDSLWFCQNPDCPPCIRGQIVLAYAKE